MVEERLRVAEPEGQAINAAFLRCRESDSGFLSKGGLFLSDINDEDKTGFMTTVHRLDRSKGLDLFLHTPGGGIAATQSIVNYLHKMFRYDIPAIVPQMAMSAGVHHGLLLQGNLDGEAIELGSDRPTS
jgi:ATP-dependent protease ClpP protease subunit